MKKKAKQIPGRLKEGWDWLRRHGASFAAAIALGTVVFLIVRQLEEQSPDSTLTLEFRPEPSDSSTTVALRSKFGMTMQRPPIG